MKRLLVDEHIARSTVEMLREMGFDVEWAVEEGFQGVDDTVLYQRAVHQKRIILTFDSDFSQMAYASQKHPAGVLVLKFKPRNTHECNERLCQALKTVGELSGKLVIVSLHPVRVRPMTR